MRLQQTEFSVGRLAHGLGRRLADVPHALAWARSSGARANRGRLAALCDLHAGERCVLLANGPSLARTDLSAVKQVPSIGMNRIYLHFPTMGFETSYFVAINELVLGQFGAEIGPLTMPKFVNWTMRAAFDPLAANLYFLRLRLALADGFSAQLTRAVDTGGTVTFVALQLAYYLGFKQVILVGLDHRFSQQGEPNKTEQRKQLKDADHFHPNYFPTGSHWQLPDLRRSELAYQLARQAFEADGREILDATIDGACTVFPKVSLEKVL